MRNRMILAGVFLTITVIALAANYTKQQHVAMTNSTIDSTPIGASTASTGNFTNTSTNNLNTNHLTWQGGAQTNYVLTGNGNEFVPAPIPVPPQLQIVTATNSGCLFGAWNNLVSCSFTFTWNGAFQDDNYRIIGCLANTNNGASVIVSQAGGQTGNGNGFPMVQTLVMINGVGSGWRPQITCSAVHN